VEDEVVGRGAARVCLVGSAPPRRCGIATFTDDLRLALTASVGAPPAVQVAVTDPGGAYDYADGVVFEVQESQPSDYLAAAAFVNGLDVDVVCVQHEFGIFGGPTGRHIDRFLDRVDAPVVTTLHTVLRNPSPEVRAATRRLADRSSRLVVLADQAVELLEVGYGIPSERVAMIPHGVPELPPVDQPAAKAAVGAAGRTLLLTFGLLGPSKGIEVAIEAMPAVVAAHPDVLYLVLGATHPHVRQEHGEAYRSSLEARVHELGLDDHVRSSTATSTSTSCAGTWPRPDVYITPYHGAEQIVSGTLAYAVGMGRAVVSTPYRYAVEMLGDGRGSLVPFGDAGALAAAVDGLLADDEARAAVQRRAREHGRSMAWPAVARLVRRPLRRGDRRAPAAARPLDARRGAATLLRLPPEADRRHRVLPARDPRHPRPGPRLLHRRRRPRPRGRRAGGGAPRRPGRRRPRPDLPELPRRRPAAGRDVREPAHLRPPPRPRSDSEDTLGQALWGLGETVSGSPDAGARALAAELVGRSLPAAGRLTATRATAYALVGLHGHLGRFPGAVATATTMRHLATRLASRLADHRGPGWTWFDDALTYGNAKVRRRCS
jgi:glycosyltransferase involved in cell wall biosynthesis